MKHILTASAIFIGLSGCSSDSTSPPANVTDALLNGTWATSCLDLGTASWIKAVLTINNGNIAGTVTDYNDDNCTAFSTTLSSETYTYTFGDNVTVDGTVAGITAAIQVDTTDTTIGSADAGTIEYDIIALLNANTLYYGDSDGANDGTTPALRPTQLDGSVPFTKQNTLLNGTWIRDCVIVSTESFNATTTLNNGNGNIVITEYSGTTCTTVTMINPTIDFTYTTGKNITLDGSVAGITTASEMNFDFTGSPQFDLVVVDNLTDLYFGDIDSDVNFNGTTVAKRAIKLDPVPYRKQ